MQIWINKYLLLLNYKQVKVEKYLKTKLKIVEKH